MMREVLNVESLPVCKVKTGGAGDGFGEGFGAYCRE